MSAMPGKSGKPGFSLLEILVATAILAIVFAYTSGAVIQGGYMQQKAPMYSNASLLIRGAVLDIEAESRKDGFPEEDVTGETCELPDEIGEGFDCEYDIEKLDIEGEELQAMANTLMENLLAGTGEGGSILQAFSVLSFLFIAGDSPISALCPATPSQFLTMCSIRPEVIEQNIMGMVTFFPSIIQQAAEKTRKLKVRLRHKSLDEPILEIETFIVAVPEEQKWLTESDATNEGTADAGDGTNQNAKKVPPPPPPPSDGADG